jgi:hypothetical protein
MAPWQPIVAQAKNQAAETIQAYLRGYSIRKKLKRYKEMGSSENTSWSEIEKGVSRVINYVSPSEIRSKLRSPRGIKEAEPPIGMSEQRVQLEQIMLDDGSTYEGEWVIS